MKNDGAMAIITLGFALIGALLGAAFGAGASAHHMQKIAIEKRAAYYHPITSEFTWRELPALTEVQVPVEKTVTSE